MQPAGGGGGFLAAAQQGMFAVDTASAGQMTMSIRQMQETLNVRLARIHQLRAQAKLGDLREARVIAGRNELVASGDEQSLHFALQRFAERLEEAHQALEVCMRNYTEIEALAEQNLGRMSHG
ncbi:MAG: hypothetical protein ACRDRX_19680 [Pseudonocardiaceae bacterium]